MHKYMDRSHLSLLALALAYVVEIGNVTCC